MKRTMMSLIFAVGFTSLLVLGVPGGAAAADFDEGLPFICSNRLLAGSYGFNADGFFDRDPDTPEFELGVFAGVGVITFREDGTLTVTVRESNHGRIDPPETFPGSYIVAADCTGTAEFEDVTWAFVATDNANEINLMSTRPGTVITADAKRLFRR
jgi:hypothetical protein